TNIGQPTWSAVSPSTIGSVVIRPDPIHFYSPGLGDFTMTADPTSATVVYIGALYRGDAAGNQGLGSWTPLVGGPTNGTSPHENLAGGAWSERGQGGDGGFVAVDNSGATALHYFMSDGPAAFFRTNPFASSVRLASTPDGALFSGLDPADQVLANGADYSPFP